MCGRNIGIEVQMLTLDNHPTYGLGVCRSL